MSGPAITWGQLKRYFIKRGYLIITHDDDAIIIAPPNDKPRSRNGVRINQRYSSRDNTVIPPVYLRNIENAFGITRDEILNDN